MKLTDEHARSLKHLLEIPPDAWHMAPPCFEPSEMAYGAHNGDPRWLMRLTPVARRGLAVMLSDA